MQNAGHYGPGTANQVQQQPPAAPSQQPQYLSLPSEPSPTGSSNGSTTSLRQFRKKDVEKGPESAGAQKLEARVAPHSHYPPSHQPPDYRYPLMGHHQYQDFSPTSLGPQPKYDLSENQHSQNSPISTSVIQKPKHMEICQQSSGHLKQAYPHQIGPSNHHQGYGVENSPILQSPTQMHPSAYKAAESQYYSKEQYHHQMSSHHAQKYHQMMPPQNLRKYQNPGEEGFLTKPDSFLSKLSKLNPNMARSIMNEHHLQESIGGQPPGYPGMDQRMIYQNNQRYYSGAIHPSQMGYQANNYPPMSYANYAPSCNYNRTGNMAGAPPNRYNPQLDRDNSPSRRPYSENLHHMAMCATMSQKLQNYPSQYNQPPEYAQHYRHRRDAMGAVIPQEYYQQATGYGRPPQYMGGHQIPAAQGLQEVVETGPVSLSDNLKKFVENWMEEEEITGENTNILDNGTLNVGDQIIQVSMVNPSDVPFLENRGIPVVTPENGHLSLTPEGFQYLIKTGIDPQMVKIIEASNKESIINENGIQEKVVSLHIVDQPKTDCMMANHTQTSETTENKKVLVHQNKVIQPCSSNVSSVLTSDFVERIPNINQNLENIGVCQPNNATRSHTKELVDKNCSPINLSDLSENLNNKDIAEARDSCIKSVQNKPDDSSSSEGSRSPSGSLKSMPIIDAFDTELNTVKNDQDPLNSNNKINKNISSIGDSYPDLDQEAQKLVDSICDETDHTSENQNNTSLQSKSNKYVLQSQTENSNKKEKNENNSEKALDLSDYSSNDSSNLAQKTDLNNGNIHQNNRKYSVNDTMENTEPVSNLAEENSSYDDLDLPKSNIVSTPESSPVTIEIPSVERESFLAVQEENSGQQAPINFKRKRILSIEDIIFPKSTKENEKLTLFHKTMVFINREKEFSSMEHYDLVKTNQIKKTVENISTKKKLNELHKINFNCIGDLIYQHKRYHKSMSVRPNLRKRRAQSEPISDVVLRKKVADLSDNNLSIFKQKKSVAVNTDFDYEKDANIMDMNNELHHCTYNKEEQEETFADSAILVINEDKNILSKSYHNLLCPTLSDLQSSIFNINMPLDQKCVSIDENPLCINLKGTGIQIKIGKINGKIVIKTEQASEKEGVDINDNYDIRSGSDNYVKTDKTSFKSEDTIIETNFKDKSGSEDNDLLTNSEEKSQDTIKKSDPILKLTHDKEITVVEETGKERKNLENSKTELTGSHRNMKAVNVINRKIHKLCDNTENIQEINIFPKIENRSLAKNPFPNSQTNSDNLISNLSEKVPIKEVDIKEVNLASKKIEVILKEIEENTCLSENNCKNPDVSNDEVYMQFNLNQENEKKLQFTDHLLNNNKTAICKANDCQNLIEKPSDSMADTADIITNDMKDIQNKHTIQMSGEDTKRKNIQNVPHHSKIKQVSLETKASEDSSQEIATKLSDRGITKNKTKKQMMFIKKDNEPDTYQDNKDKLNIHQEMKDYFVVSNQEIIKPIDRPIFQDNIVTDNGLSQKSLIAENVAYSSIATNDNIWLKKNEGDSVEITEEKILTDNDEIASKSYANYDNDETAFKSDICDVKNEKKLLENKLALTNNETQPYINDEAKETNVMTNNHAEVFLIERNNETLGSNRQGLKNYQMTLEGKATPSKEIESAGKENTEFSPLNQTHPKNIDQMDLKCDILHLENSVENKVTLPVNNGPGEPTTQSNSRNKKYSLVSNLGSVNDLILESASNLKVHNTTNASTENKSEENKKTNDLFFKSCVVENTDLLLENNNKSKVITQHETQEQKKSNIDSENNVLQQNDFCDQRCVTLPENDKTTEISMQHETQNKETYEMTLEGNVLNSNSILVSETDVTLPENDNISENTTQCEIQEEKARETNKNEISKGSETSLENEHTSQITTQHKTHGQETNDIFPESNLLSPVYILHNESSVTLSETNNASKAKVPMLSSQVDLISSEETFCEIAEEVTYNNSGDVLMEEEIVLEEPESTAEEHYQFDKLLNEEEIELDYSEGPQSEEFLEESETAIIESSSEISELPQDIIDCPFEESLHEILLEDPLEIGLVEEIGRVGASPDHIIELGPLEDLEVRVKATEEKIIESEYTVDSSDDIQQLDNINKDVNISDKDIKQKQPRAMLVFKKDRHHSGPAPFTKSRDVMILSPTSTNNEDSALPSFNGRPINKRMESNECVSTCSAPLTKAAKKQYDCDLQSTAISTTSAVPERSMSVGEPNSTSVEEESKKVKEFLKEVQINLERLNTDELKFKLSQVRKFTEKEKTESKSVKSSAKKIILDGKRTKNHQNKNQRNNKNIQTKKFKDLVEDKNKVVSIVKLNKVNSPKRSKRIDRKIKSKIQNKEMLKKLIAKRMSKIKNIAHNKLSKSVKNEDKNKQTTENERFEDEDFADFNELVKRHKEKKKKILELKIKTDQRPEETTQDHICLEKPNLNAKTKDVKTKKANKEVSRVDLNKPKKEKKHIKQKELNKEKHMPLKQNKVPEKKEQEVKRPALSSTKIKTLEEQAKTLIAVTSQIRTSKPKKVRNIRKPEPTEEEEKVCGPKAEIEEGEIENSPEDKACTKNLNITKPVDILPVPLIKPTEYLTGLSLEQKSDSRQNKPIMVPSVSEFIEENKSSFKRKITLQDYKKKRKIISATSCGGIESKLENDSLTCEIEFKKSKLFQNQSNLTPSNTGKDSDLAKTLSFEETVPTSVANNIIRFETIPSKQKSVDISSVQIISNQITVERGLESKSSPNGNKQRVDPRIKNRTKLIDVPFKNEPVQSYFTSPAIEEEIVVHNHKEKNVKVNQIYVPKNHSPKRPDDLSDRKGKSHKKSRRKSVEACLYSPETEVNHTVSYEETNKILLRSSNEWEDTNSPKRETISDADSLNVNFSGLIMKNSKPIIDVDELKLTIDPEYNPDNEEHENQVPETSIEQYRERIDSELSSLSLNIPKINREPVNIYPKFNIEDIKRPLESNELVKRFLENEKMTDPEMEIIKRIISYKRMIYHNQKNPSDNLSILSGNSQRYELKNSGEDRMKLHFKRLGSFKRKIEPQTANTNWEEKIPKTFDQYYIDKKNIFVEEAHCSKNWKETQNKLYDEYMHLERNLKDKASGSTIWNEPEQRLNDYSVQMQYSSEERDKLPKIIFKRTKTSDEPVVVLERLEVERIREKYNLSVNGVSCD